MFKGEVNKSVSTCASVLVKVTKKIPLAAPNSILGVSGYFERKLAQFSVPGRKVSLLKYAPPSNPPRNPGSRFNQTIVYTTRVACERIAWRRLFFTGQSRT